MKRIEEIAEGLVGMDVDEDFENNVICAFGEAEDNIIVSKDETNSNIDYQAYEDRADAPIVCIQVENDKVKDAWVY